MLFDIIRLSPCTKFIDVIHLGSVTVRDFQVSSCLLFCYLYLDYIIHKDVSLVNRFCTFLCILFYVLYNVARLTVKLVAKIHYSVYRHITIFDQSINKSRRQIKGFRIFKIGFCYSSSFHCFPKSSI